MKARFLFVAAMSIAALAAGSVSADQLKIGYVNTSASSAMLRRRSKRPKEAGRNFPSVTRICSVWQNSYRGMQENLEKNSVTMSGGGPPHQREGIRRTFPRIPAQTARIPGGSEPSPERGNAAVIEKANKAIKQIAETEKYDLILQDVVWVSPRLDITEKVIKALSEAK